MRTLLQETTTHESCTYTDVGLLTADEQIGADATELFNYLTGCSRQTNYRRLFVAPVTLRAQINALIDRESNTKSGSSRADCG